MSLSYYLVSFHPATFPLNKLKLGLAWPAQALPLSLVTGEFLGFLVDKHSVDNGTFTGALKKPRDELNWI